MDRRVEENMLRHNVDIFRGIGSFQNRNTLKVTSQKKEPEYLKGDVILIATGSSPRWPDDFPRSRHIYDSDTIFLIKDFLWLAFLLSLLNPILCFIFYVLFSLLYLT